MKFFNFFHSNLDFLSLFCRILQEFAGRPTWKTKKLSDSLSNILNGKSKENRLEPKPDERCSNRV